MPFQLSPGVAVVEKDFSAIVPAVSSSAGAYCGPFAWGPIEDPVRVSSETDLVTRFGQPNNENFQSFFTAANFLAYTNNLLVTRTNAEGLKNAVATKTGSVSQSNVVLTEAGSGYAPGTPGEVPAVVFTAPDFADGVTAEAEVVYTDDTVDNVTTRTITGIIITNPGSGYRTPPAITIEAPAAGIRAEAEVTSISVGGVKIKNISDYLQNFNDGSGVYGEFAAKFAGSKGNGIRVVLVDSGSWTSAPSSIKTLFNGAPSTSSYASARQLTDDEVHVAVFDNSIGEFSGVAGSLLEKYSFLSKLTDAKKSDGSNNYYKSVINSQSKYVWWMDHPNAGYMSEPIDLEVVDNELGASAVISASAKTITIQDQVHFNKLAAFKLFYDSAIDKSTRQIALSGTVSNNAVYTITSITTTLSGQNISGYVIAVSQTPVDEVVADLSITSVSKAAWGQSASSAALVVGADKMAVMQNYLNVTLSGGTDDFGSNDDDIQNAYSLLTNTDEYDISLIPLGNVSPTTAQYVVNNVAEVRKDCIVFMSPNADMTTGGEPITSTGSTATDAIVAYRSATQLSTSYAVIDSGFKYQYDRYNDAYRWIPLNGDVAGLCARTDYTADPWYSPGGFNRGQIKNVVKLGFNPNQSDRDALYASGVNPVVSFPGQGVVLYGDKTMQTKPSAFDRINVRRLFIVLEKAIATAAKYQMFEFNDSFTRAQFKNLVEPFLRDVQGRRGVTDFRVKCDETNNTGEIIDRNEFVADIFIKPNRSINFITLNFVAARTSVSFEEIGG